VNCNKKPYQEFLHFILFTCILFSPFFAAIAQPPAGYYNNATGLTGATLKTALYNIIKNHTIISYSALLNAYYTTDDKPNGKVWDMYSDIPGGIPPYEFTFGSSCGSANYNEGDCYNREHSFPKSWFGDVSPMNSDIFHIYPTDYKVNNERNNFPYGEVNNPTWTSLNGSKLGASSSPGYSGTVFEPIDSFKGDFARSYFYMATRYQNIIASWQNIGTANVVLDGTSFPCFDQWFLNVLLAWSSLDPVSQKEIDRNNTIFTNFQHNRNPYIDHPEYINAIWGGGSSNLKPEPTNYPLHFTANNFQLQWTDATGNFLPEHYLIRMSNVGFNAITDPVDGVSYPDSATDRNVAYGVQNAWFLNLNGNTTYYFKIFAYRGSGSTTDYKTDGVVPQISQWMH
jgi:endonuclease I